MYILNGFVCAEKEAGRIRVHSARVLDNHMILVTFEGGETRLFDATILTGGVFDRLQDAELLKKVEIDHGVMTWDDGNIDCAPEYVYKNSFAYISPEHAEQLVVV